MLFQSLVGHLHREQGSQQGCDRKSCSLPPLTSDVDPLGPGPQAVVEVCHGKQWHGAPLLCLQPLPVLTVSSTFTDLHLHSSSLLLHCHRKVPVSCPLRTATLPEYRPSPPPLHEVNTALLAHTCSNSFMIRYQILVSLIHPKYHCLLKH